MVYCFFFLSVLQLEFAVGNGETAYPGYRMMLEAEWKDPEVQGRLVAAHQANGGWPLLEDPLDCDLSGLCIPEQGQLVINNASVTQVGKSNVRVRYAAMNYITEAPWTTTAPTVSDAWAVNAHKGRKSAKAFPWPCLPPFLRW